MGVSRITAADWLLANEDAQLEERRRLLAERRDEVVAIQEPAVEAVEELAVAVANHLDLDDDAFVWDPLGQIGAAVCEDFCVLVEQAGELRMSAAVVCFPSHWRLSEKLGGNMQEIHVPVPGYEDELGTRVDTFLGRLEPGAIFCRRNWSIQAVEDLFAPFPRPEPSIEGAFMRSERQTFRRLPESGAIIFTIRTQQAPLAALAENPEVRERLEQWIAAAPRELVRARTGAA